MNEEEDNIRDKIGFLISIQKLIAYPLSVIYYLLFGNTLVIFHVIQGVCFNLFDTRPTKNPKFVSKIELGRRIPSISYTLNNEGSVLIERKTAYSTNGAFSK